MSTIKILLHALALISLTTGTRGEDCTPVPKDKCGTDWDNSCLKCGTASAYDCEECCPNCKQVTKGEYKYCECGKGPSPGPGPSPSPSPDTWTNYKVAGMDVMAVVGGKNQSYDTVVVMLHGGGGSGSDWRYQYDQGWFGNISGFKYVFPTSPLEGNVWYIDFKNPACGLNDDCAYNLTSIQDTGSRVAQLINQEKAGVGGDGSKVYLAGFSEGAQLTGYVQIAQLDFALGGAVVMDGYPLPPLCDMPGAAPAAAKKNATYYGSDMRWMIWHGSADPIFPEEMTINAWNGIFDALEVKSTVKIEHVEPGMTHTLIESEFVQLQSFVRGNDAATA